MRKILAILITTLTLAASAWASLCNYSLAVNASARTMPAPSPMESPFESQNALPGAGNVATRAGLYLANEAMLPSNGAEKGGYPQVAVRFGNSGDLIQESGGDFGDGLGRFYLSAMESPFGGTSALPGEYGPVSSPPTMEAGLGQRSVSLELLASLGVAAAFGHWYRRSQRGAEREIKLHPGEAAGGLRRQFVEPPLAGVVD
jgi:hypothetical protein